jgi:hypothetical protein
MNYKELLQKVRDAYNTAIAPVTAAMAPAPAPTPTTTEYTLADGATKVSISKLEVGGVITPTPAAEGTIVLQDGTSITYDATGVILTITAAAPAPAPAPVQTELNSQEAIKAYLDKFTGDNNISGAGGTDMSKLVTIVKFMFEDRFGWELKRAEEEAKRTQAIEIYKTGFTAIQTPIQELFDLVSKIAEHAPAATEKQEDIDWDSLSPLQKFRLQKKELSK